MTANLIKEIVKLNRHIEKITNGQVTTIDYCDLENESCIKFWIEPNDGLWEGGAWRFKVFFPEQYPDCPPQVTCMSDDLLHPHIEENYGSICFNLLEEDWDSNCRIVDVIMGMLFLFYQVDWSDALTSHFCEFSEDCGYNFDEDGAKNKILEQINETNWRYIKNMTTEISKTIVNRTIECVEPSEEEKEEARQMEEIRIITDACTANLINRTVEYA